MKLTVRYSINSVNSKKNVLKLPVDMEMTLDSVVGEALKTMDLSAVSSVKVFFEGEECDDLDLPLRSLLFDRPISTAELHLRLERSEAEEGGDAAAGPSADPEIVFDYVSVDKLEKEFLCPICRAPPVNAVEVFPCGDIFCARCLAGAEVSHPGKCPGCTSAIAERRAPSRVLVQRLDRLRVYCPNRAHGCGETTDRSDVTDHLQKNCEHVRCAHADAGCAWKGKEAARGDHQRADCLYEEVPCPKACGARVPRRGVQEHLADCRVVREEAQRAAEEAERRRRAEEERLRREFVQAQMDACRALNPSEDDFLQLRIGRSTFSACRADLLKRKDSLLAVMFGEGSNQLQRNASGEVMLNLDDEAFLFVLRWLQLGVVPMTGSPYQRALVLSTARALKLDGLVAAMGGAATASGAGIALGQGDAEHRLAVSNCANGGRLALPGYVMNDLYLAGTRMERALLRGADLSRCKLATCARPRWSGRSCRRRN